jgi:hypothetical protein
MGFMRSPGGRSGATVANPDRECGDGWGQGAIVAYAKFYVNR